MKNKDTLENDAKKKKKKKQTENVNVRNEKILLLAHSFNLFFFIFIFLLFIYFTSPFVEWTIYKSPITATSGDYVALHIKQENKI